MDLTEGDGNLEGAAQEIARAARLGRNEHVASTGDSSEAARLLAASLRATPPDDGAPPTSVFVVHGHDGEFAAAVEEYLAVVGVTAIVLKRAGGSSQSLFGEVPPVRVRGQVRGRANHRGRPRCRTQTVRP